MRNDKMLFLLISSMICLLTYASGWPAHQAVGEQMFTRLFPYINSKEEGFDLNTWSDEYFFLLVDGSQSPDQYTDYGDGAWNTTQEWFYTFISQGGTDIYNFENYIRCTSSSKFVLWGQ